jgi:SnoaL-like domain
MRHGTEGISIDGLRTRSKERRYRMDDYEILAEVYGRFNARDIDAVLKRMHPEVVWPNGMEGGWVYGHDEVRAYWTRQWAVVDPHVEPVGFATEEDGRIAVTVQQTVRDMEGKVLLDRLVEHVYRMEDGLIRGMEIRELAEK